MGIPTVPLPALKTALGLMGRVRLVGRAGVERLIKERIPDREVVATACRAISETVDTLVEQMDSTVVEVQQHTTPDQSRMLLRAPVQTPR
jgi:hypothetical protein